LTYAGGIKRTSCPGVADSPTPVMGAPAGLHGDDAAWLLGKKAEDFLARELLSKGYASIRLSAVRLKGPLCKVETNNGSSFHGCPLRSVGCDKHRHLGTLRCRQEGASTPSTPLGEAAQTRAPVLSDLCREHRAKPVPPKSDGLMADVDPALGQEILDVSQRQWVPHVHHYDQTDHFWRAVEIPERVAHGLTLAWPRHRERFV
jgi:hypothetical protein